MGRGCRVQVDGIRPEIGHDIGRLAEVVPIELAEPGRRTVVKRISADPLTMNCDWAHSLPVPVGYGVGERPELTNGLGPFVKGEEGGKTERPTTFGKPITLLEVERIERAAFTGPFVGRPAELPGPRRIEREILSSFYLAGVKRLRGRFSGEPAGLQENGA
jgi:hypothetical protein